MRLLPDAIGQQYMFGHGRLTVLMHQLLTQTDIDHFLGAHDASAALKLLAERPFAAHTEGSLNERLVTIQKQAWSVVQEMIAADSLPVFDVLRLSSTEPLIAYTVKSMRGLTSSIAEKPLSTLSLCTEEDLRVFFNDPTSHVPMARELRSLKKTIDEAGDVSGKDIDAIVASWSASISLKRAKKYGSARIVAYVRHTIDLHNVRSYIRFRDDASKYMLQGGLLPLSTFRGNHTTFRMNLARTPYDFLVSDAMDRNDEEWIALELAIATLRTDDLHAMWNTTLGPEPVFAFFATILEQSAVLRALMIGKENGFAPQEIKRALPPLLTASHYSL